MAAPALASIARRRRERREEVARRMDLAHEDALFALVRRAELVARRIFAFTAKPSPVGMLSTALAAMQP